MVEAFRIVLFLVLLPIGLVGATRLSSWPLYRKICLIALAFWLCGLGAVVFVNVTCESGNLLYGYSGCGAMPRWVRLNLPAYGLFSMLGALVVFTGMTVAMLIRILLQNRRPS